MAADLFDYIIIGAGSAGCVLANRLTQSGRLKIALIEAGGSDNHVFVQMPSALSYPMNMRRFNWGFRTAPEPSANDRQFDCPRGLGLGGSSSINGMVFVRGNPRDFDEWETHGAQGWSYEACFPYFKKLERWAGENSQYRGFGGPVSVNCGNDMRLNPLYRAFIEAGKQAGYAENPDYNGESQEGFGPMQMNVDRGIRASTAQAYLRPALNRENLHLFKKALAQRIVFEGTRASGVDIVHKGERRTLRASKEVIVSAGAIGSPHLLQVSGIGPAEILRGVGAEVVCDLPGVGQNLQDHLEVYFQYKCKEPITLNGKLGRLQKGKIGARWLFFKTGLGATNHFESCAFIRSSPDKPWPDTQYHFLPAAIRYDGKAPFSGHGYQVHVGPNKPKSRGHVAIKSANISDHPQIKFNYLSHPDDTADWRNVIRLTRTVMSQAAFDPYRGPEIQPGGDVTDDAQIDHWVRENVESAYHPSCTCKMGSASDPLAVLDPQCRVRGISGLRVVDSSIFPTIPNGNLNAPTMMVAEKAADMILAGS